MAQTRQTETPARGRPRGEHMAQTGARRRSNNSMFGKVRKNPDDLLGLPVKIEVKDLQGKIRYADYSRAEHTRNGVERKKREMLERLLEPGMTNPERKDWSGLDLSGLDFRGLNLTGFNFSGSKLTDTKFDGCNLSGTNFSNTDCEGTSFDGAYADWEVRFCGAKLDRASMSGSTFDVPNFRGAKMTDVKAPRASWTNAVMTHTRQRRVDYKEASLKNADWGRARVISCLLEGAKLTDELRATTNEALSRGGFQALDAHDYPHKMRGALFIGCKTDKKTDLSSMARGRIFRDKVTNGIARNGSALAVTALMVAPSLVIDAAGLANFMESLATMSVLYVTGIVDFIKDKVFSPVSEKLQKAVMDRLEKRREEGQSRYTNSLHNLKVVISQRGQLDHLVRALEAVKQRKSKGFANSLMEFITGDDHDIVVCDKEHLAEAVAHISSNRNRGYEVTRTISLIRQYPEENCAGIPSCVTFNKDGSTTLSWINEGKTTMLARFDEHGEFMDHLDFRAPEDAANSPNAFPNIGTLLQTLNAFERLILDDGGLTKDKFDYDPKESYVTAGENGSLFVHKSGESSLHNKKGPSIVHQKRTPTGPAWHASHHFLEGKLYNPDDFAVEAKKSDRVRAADRLMAAVSLLENAISVGKAPPNEGTPRLN